MKHKEFIRLVAENNGLSMKDARKIVNIVFGTMRDALSGGMSVHIPRVGVIYLSYVNRGDEEFTTPRGVRTKVKNRVRVCVRQSRSFASSVSNKINESMTFLRGR